MNSLTGCLPKLCHRKGYNGPRSEAYLHFEPEAVQVGTIIVIVKRNTNNLCIFQRVEFDPQCNMVPGRKLICECDLRRIHPNNFPYGYLKVSRLCLVLVQQPVNQSVDNSLLIVL